MSGIDGQRIPVEPGVIPEVPPAGDNLFSALERWSIRLTRPIAFLGVVGMLMVSGFTLYDVTVRWLFGTGVAALNEIVSMTFAVAICACIPAGLAEGVNLKVDLLENHIRGRWHDWVHAIGGLITVAFFALLSWRLALYASALAAEPRKTIILGWPQAPFMFSAAVLISLGAIAQLIKTCKAIRTALLPSASAPDEATPTWAKAFILILTFLVIGLLAAVSANPARASAWARDNAGLTLVISSVLLWGLLLAVIPVAAIMGFFGLAGTMLFLGLNPALSAFATENAGFLTNSQVAVLPLFLMMGSFAAVAGLADDVYALAHAVLCRFRGGLAMATIGGCAGFGAVTGSAVATAATIGRVAIPEMRSRGYSPALTSGCVAAGGTLGNLVPPGSGPLILFALLTEASIGQLFIASIFPAVLAVLAYLVTIALYVKISPTSAPALTAPQAGELLAGLRRCGPITLLFVLVLGGLYTGIFTASESAAVGAFLAFLIAWWRGGLGRGRFWQVMSETTATTALVYSLIFGALIFSFFAGASGLAEAAGRFITDLKWPPLAVIALLLVVFIVLGTFMESYAIMLITIPIVTPLVLALGYDVVWWGVVNLFVVEIGGISPPFGLTMFVLKGIQDIPMVDIFKGVLPFCAAAIAALLLVVLFPQIAMWLPSTMN